MNVFSLAATPKQPCQGLHLLLPLSLLVLLHMQPSELRAVGTCERVHSKCGGEDDWQPDAVCNRKRVCVAADEREFSFTLTVRLRPLPQAEAGKVSGSLWMRGTGPGLSWTKPIELRRSAQFVDTWKTQIDYRSSSEALLCTNSKFCFENQRALEFRLYRDTFGKENMKGPNFYIPLPISHSLKRGGDFLPPSVTVYPWFDGGDIIHKTINVRSSLHVTGRAGELSASLDILYPPSFNYNSRKKYPVVFIIDYNVETLSPLLEYGYIHEASIEEALVVGIRPFEQVAPYSMSSPYYNNYVWRCKKDHCEVNCQTCWKQRLSVDICDVDEFNVQASRCLYAQLIEAKGDQILDLIELDIVPQLKEMAQERLLVDPPKHRLSLIGFNGNGLLACYAALTRPWVYQNVGCLSAPFYWPLTSSLTKPAPSPGIFETLQRVKKDIEQNPALLSSYLSQKYYIDVTEHAHTFLPIVDIHEHTDNFVLQLQEILQLERNKNILFFNLPGVFLNYIHNKQSYFEIYHRILPALKLFLRAEGGPSKDGARIHLLSNGEAIAENKELYGSLIGTGNETSLEQESCIILQSSKPTEVPIVFFIPTLGKRNCWLDHFTLSHLL